MAERFVVSLDKPTGASVTALAHRASGQPLHATLILAHGAGANQFSRFIVAFAIGLAARGLDIVTFNFLYTEQRRRLPDRTDQLELCYRAVIDAAAGRPEIAANRLFIGGKSLGGRIASHVAAGKTPTAASRATPQVEPPPGARSPHPEADQPGISGLVLFGYPLHPPGKPDQLRVKHLPDIRVPILFVQGSRDAFGTPDELRPILERLTAATTLSIVEGGDHSLAVPKGSRRSQEQVFATVQDQIAGWVADVLSKA